jgi:hypothetical protein
LRPVHGDYVESRVTAGRKATHLIGMAHEHAKIAPPERAKDTAALAQYPESLGYYDMTPSRPSTQKTLPAIEQMFAYFSHA